MKRPKLMINTNPQNVNFEIGILPENDEYIYGLTIWPASD